MTKDERLEIESLAAKIAAHRNEPVEYEHLQEAKMMISGAREAARVLARCGR